MNLNQKLIKLFISEIKKLSVFKPVGSIKKNKLKVNYFSDTRKINQNEIKKILIIRLGGIGDVVMSLPSVKSLALKYPKAKISFLTYDYNILFLKKVKFIENVYDIKNILKKQIFQKTDFDLIINFDNSLLSSLVAKVIESKYKKGLIFYKKNIFETSSKSAIYLNKLYSNKKFRKINKQHISRIFCKIADVSFLDINISKDLKKFNHDEIYKIKNLLNKFPRHNKIIAIHPGSNWNSKILDFKIYAKIINFLIHKNYNIIMLGSKKEITIEKKITKLIYNKKKYLNLVNKYRLDLLPIILKKSKLLISNDTGTMHFTYFTETKGITFFGPTSPVESGSMNKNCINIKSNNKFAPCFSNKCACFKKDKSKKCIDVINIDKVLRLINRQI